MLWDKFPPMPFHAVAPWPYWDDPGQWDWVNSVDCVETWLNRFVGQHYVHWAWDMYSLHNPQLCGVGFVRERDVSLFLLKFG
jgi:hypothetical protein